MVYPGARGREVPIYWGQKCKAEAWRAGCCARPTTHLGLQRGFTGSISSPERLSPEEKAPQSGMLYTSREVTKQGCTRSTSLTKGWLIMIHNFIHRRYLAYGTTVVYLPRIDELLAPTDGNYLRVGLVG